MEYHEQFEILFERYTRWMKDAESRLAKHTSSGGMESDYDIEEHYRSIEVSFPALSLQTPLSISIVQNLINENVDGESLLSNLDDCLEQVLKSTSLEGRTPLKYLFTESQTRWSNYNTEQKQLKQKLHTVKLTRMEFDETLTEIHDWIIEHRYKLNELTTNLSLRDENRKRLYQLKSFSNDINVKQTLLNTLKEKSPENEKFNQIQHLLGEFQEELRTKILSLEEFLRTQNSIEESKQLIMERLKFLMDRLALCTKTDCDFETLQSRLKKIQVRRFLLSFPFAMPRFLGISNGIRTSGKRFPGDL